MKVIFRKALYKLSRQEENLQNSEESLNLISFFFSMDNRGQGYRGIFKVI